VRLDNSDKQVLALWGVRFAAAFIVVIGAALLAGLALRIFQIASGM